MLLPWLVGRDLVFRASSSPYARLFHNPTHFLFRAFRCGGLVSISFHFQDLLSSSSRRSPVLKELDLSQNNIASVERASLFYLEQLEVIDLSNNLLDETNFWMVRGQSQRIPQAPFFCWFLGADLHISPRARYKCGDCF
jgi:hypothetical protein